MLKNILISGLLCTLLSAQSFDEFLQKAIDNSPYLKASTLNLEQAQEEGSALTRYANPSLALEYSNFSPDIGERDNGYRVNLSQPLRLWGVGSAKDRLSHLINENAKVNYISKKALFIRDISLAFSLYSQKKMLRSLGNEELKIAKTIYEISKARYEVGTISRGVMLQSQVAFELIGISNNTLSLQSEQSYYSLLKFAGINEEISLDTSSSFKLLSTKSTNPKILKFEAAGKQALAEADVNSNAVEWVKVFAEYESEPEQDIARIGLNIPLAVFNTKSQEKTIAKLEATKSELLVLNETTQQDIEKTRLSSQRQRLELLKSQNQKILITEEELLIMFKEGYKIANINLLELQDIKNKMIETKEAIIQIQNALNQNIIYTNYLQGSYNDY
ncbi:MAG: hypothetical protein COA44_13015 [Arcobacter sp.]|nr:MAG: hypothetical protein COA44_13015 [Arcobacter sp.]